MSEKKSFDLAPRKKATAPAAARPNSGRTSTARTRVKPFIRTSKAYTKEPLKVRRARERKRFYITSAVFLISFFALCIFALWQDTFRISEVVVVNSSKKEEVTKTIVASLEGMRGIVPKNSIFFFPMEYVRVHILETYPEFSSVSIARTTFHTIIVTPVRHEEAFMWCGIEKNISADSCYSVNAEGLLYEQVIQSEDILTGSTTSSRNIKIFGHTDTASSTLKAHMLHSENMADIFRFIRAVTQLKIPVDSVEIVDDEAKLYVEGKNTYIRYILKHEQEALDLLTSAYPKLSLSDGTTEYVDLRFSGKVFVKKVNALREENATTTPH
jgi:hypothetical protein